MRKLFLLIPAMLLTLATYATETPVAPGTNAIRDAVAAASANDVLVLSTGTYTEEGNFDLKKNLTIRAAEGQHPEIVQTYYFRVEGGAQVTFKGIKFNGASDHCIRSYGASTGTEDVTIEDCEFTGYTSYVIYTQRDARSWNSITIRNCYFHNNAKCAVRIDNDGGESTKQSCNSLTIENSTFADMSTGGNYSVIYYNAPAAEHNATLSVNHCTFYNHPYPAIEWNLSSNVTIKNSIFAQPTSLNKYSISCVEGSTIDYCLAYKTNGFSQASTNDRTGNPYFMNTNPANYDFTIWTTSPAHGTADDGYDLGDYLRWNTDPATHEATVNITADDANSLKAAVDAALPGDEIILAAGTYEESESISLDKEITIKAAEGAHPIVKPVGNFALNNAADITIENIKFDGSDQSGVSNFIYADDATNNSLAVEGCEFYNFGNAVISATSSKLIGTCTVNNCQFYDNTHSCIGLKNSAAANLTVSNSTFNNIDASGVGDGNGIGIVESKTATGTMLVDHCTFYNCKVLNTDFGITKVASPNATVSNCIFTMPTSTSGLRTVYIPSGLEAGTTVTNCIMHNFTHDSNIGVPARSGSIITNCSTSNPLFTDAANGDFSFSYNWSTGSISPAKEAATDGSDLGDPRWYRDNEVIPSSSIASSYDLLSTKAQLIGDIELNASNHIKYKGTATPGTAKWKLHVDRTCMISAVVDREAGNSSGCQLTLTVKDADGNNVGSLAMTSASYNDNDINLPGTITFSAAGDYTFILTNSTSGSASALEKITLSYFGGAVQNIATDANTTLNVAEAWFSCCTRDNDKTYIQYPSSETSSAWIKWNIATSETKYYDLTVNVNTTYAHEFGIAIYEDENEDPVASAAEPGYTSSTGDGLALELGRVNLVGGKNYVVKVTNATSGSQAKVTSVVFAPVVPTATTLPGTLAFSNAVLSEKANITDGMLYFNEPDADKDPRGQWAQWEVTTDHNGLFLFTMGVTSTNEQSYKITIKDNSENELDFYETNPGSGDKELEHYFALNAGTYFVKVENTRSYSKGHLTSLVVTEPAGVVTIDEAATSTDSWADKVGETTYDVQIIRTIVAGMYNTLCLPFAVSSDQCKDIFGADVQIRTLESSTIEEGDFVLNLNFKVASDIYQGTPILIQTSRDIVNPVFTGVKFAAAAPATSTTARANFIGNFAKGTIPAGENNLFMGANNTLYFPTVDTEILGMRAYFRVHDVVSSVIQRIRIVEADAPAITTDINRVEVNASVKTIENGQLVIIRDGKKYNVMGVRIK